MTNRERLRNLLLPKEWLLRFVFWSGVLAVGAALIAHGISRVVCPDPLYKALAERFVRCLSAPASRPAAPTGGFR